MSMRERTSILPDEVVNQRLRIEVYVTATGERSGTMAVAVWADRSSDPAIPGDWQIESWRGWFGADRVSELHGEGLSDEERVYVSAALDRAAEMIAGE